MIAKANLVGAVTTIFIYVLYIIMFVLRLLGLPELGHKVASNQFLAVIPLIFLLVTASGAYRPAIYRVQIILMLFVLLVSLILDYILEYPWRDVRWMLITYVTLFFAGTGGLLGIISKMENRAWSIAGVGLYLIMAVLAFVSRAVTGI